MTLKRWRCRACGLAFVVSAAYAMVVCPGCATTSPVAELDEIVPLFCTRCSTRFDLHRDILDPSNELLYCPRCKLEKPVPADRLSRLSQAGGSGG